MYERAEGHFDSLHKWAYFCRLSFHESEESRPHLLWICCGSRFPRSASGMEEFPEKISLVFVTRSLWKALAPNRVGSTGPALPISEDNASFPVDTCGGSISAVLFTSGMCLRVLPHKLTTPIFGRAMGRGAAGVVFGARKFTPPSCAGARESGFGAFIVGEAAARSEFEERETEDFP